MGRWGGDVVDRAMERRAAISAERDRQLLREVNPCLRCLRLGNWERDMGGGLGKYSLHSRSGVVRYAETHNWYGYM